jgi:hypothetical protein
MVQAVASALKVPRSYSELLKFGSATEAIPTVFLSSTARAYRMSGLKGTLSATIIPDSEEERTCGGDDAFPSRELDFDALYHDRKVAFRDVVVISSDSSDEG